MNSVDIIVLGREHHEMSDGTLIPRIISLVPVSPQVLQSELHLLTLTPEKYIKAAVDAGFKRLIAHVEAHDPRIFFEAAKYEDVEVGIAIDGATEFEEVEPFLEEADVVLVMATEAGSDKFLPECVEKIKSIHLYLPDLPIAVEGGITPQTASPLIEAGATRLVAEGAVVRLLLQWRETSQGA